MDYWPSRIKDESTGFWWDNINSSDLYSIRYDAVLAYADETCPFYSSCRLPAQLVPNPVNETALPVSTESESSKEYVCTKPENWRVLNDGEVGRTIKPVSFTGESEDFSVKITDEEVAGLKDDMVNSILRSNGLVSSSV